MEVCILQGQAITPEMPGICHECILYLNTCVPVIEYGYLTGSECDMSFCEFCKNYEECGR